MSCSIVLVFVLLNILQVDGLINGKNADRCNFPGLAVVSTAQNGINGIGVVEGSKLYLPPSLESALTGTNQALELIVKTGKQNYTIPVKSFKTSVSKGVITVDLSTLSTSGEDPSDCFQTGTIYKGDEDLKPGSCVMVGFSEQNFAGLTPHFFESTPLHKIEVTKSTSADCCKAISSTLSPKVGFESSKTYNCITAKGATCGLTDHGSPLMCETKSGKKVTLGLGNFPACDPTDIFLVYDLTQGNKKVKFGYNKAAPKAEL